MLVVTTEKVDGTNIRLSWDLSAVRGQAVNWIAGRTDRAMIPPKLLTRLASMWDALPWGDVFDGAVTLYGEGYGAGIQKGGGLYRPDPDFVLFDVAVSTDRGPLWLHRFDVEDVAVKLGIDVVRVVMSGPLAVAERAVVDGFDSAWRGVEPEGLVGRPECGLLDRLGNRVATKVKTKDYRR